MQSAMCNKADDACVFEENLKLFFMNLNTLLFRLPSMIAVVCLSAALPALGAPAKAPGSKAESSPAAASPSPVAKAHPFPFQSNVVSVDKGTRTFRMGKTTVHQVHVLPATKLLKTDGTPAKFEEIVEGIEIRGAVNKRADGDYEAVSIYIGPKAEAIPVAAGPGASPAKATPKKQ